MVIEIYCLELRSGFSPGSYPGLPKPAVGELILNCRLHDKKYTLIVDRVSHDYDNNTLAVATSIYKPR